MIVAVASLVVGAIALYPIFAPDDPGTPAEGPGSTVQAAPPPVPPTLPPPSASSSVAIRHQGRVEVAHGYSVDLDAGVEDAKWAAADPAQADLFYGNSGGFRDLYTRRPASGVMTGVNTADFDTCSSLNQYSESARIGQAALSVGTSFCIRTGAERYTAGVIVDFNQDFITLNLTTFDPPGVRATPSSATEPSAAAVRVRHQGRLQIAHGDGADLDAGGDDPKWAARVYTGADLFYGDSGGFRNLWVGNSARGVMTGIPSADYDTCSQLTIYREGALISNSKLSSGLVFCIQTGGGRYAAGSVVDFNQDYITLDLISYDPPEA